MFSGLSKINLAKALLFKNTPIYVQFYITARCNLRCKQCNIIHANSDLSECSLDQINKIADNLCELGVAIVLLTGGEPFIRKDLPAIIRAFESRGIHVRMQTNGLATEKQIIEAIESGGKDISISLDTLRPSIQEAINGDCKGSWHRALQSMSLFTRHLPANSSFAALGCVLQRDNISDVEKVIRFASKISWFTSLVPIHVMDPHKTMNFRVSDQSMRFDHNESKEVDVLIERVRQMKKDGYLLYDSDQYLDDIKRFVKGESIGWRKKNCGLCDSPNLYFVILPNGDFAPCCDYRMSSGQAVYDNTFPTIYRSSEFREKVRAVTKKCSGCMFGSFPEITVSMRFLSAIIGRTKLFLTSPPAKRWPISYDEMLSIAADIENNREERM